MFPALLVLEAPLLPILHLVLVSSNPLASVSLVLREDFRYPFARGNHRTLRRRILRHLRQLLHLSSWILELGSRGDEYFGGRRFEIGIGVFAAQRRGRGSPPDNMARPGGEVEMSIMRIS